MSYLNFSISILENYTDKSIHQIALLIAEVLQNSLNFRGLFELTDTSELEIGSVFLQSVEAVESPEYFPEDFLGVFINFPDVCFCLSVLDDCDNTASDYRVLFFNGKVVTQYPEIRYPEFHVNDFEYEASSKVVLPTITAKLKPLKVREVAPLESDSAKVSAILKNVAEGKVRGESFVGEIRQLLGLPPIEPVLTEKGVPERMGGKTAEELCDEARERGINERIDTICNMMRKGLIPISTDSAILNLIRNNL